MTGTVKKYKHKDEDRDITRNMLEDKSIHIRFSRRPPSGRGDSRCARRDGGASIHRPIGGGLRRADRIRTRVCGDVQHLQKGEEHHAIES